MKLNKILSVLICSLLLSRLAQTEDAVRRFAATFRGFAPPASPTDDPDVVELVVPLHGRGTPIGKFDELLVHYLNVVTGAFTGQGGLDHCQRRHVHRGVSWTDLSD